MTAAQAAAAINAARQAAIQRWNVQVAAQQAAQRAADQQQARVGQIQGVTAVANPCQAFRNTTFRAADGRWYYAPH